MFAAKEKKLVVATVKIRITVICGICMVVIFFLGPWHAASDRMLRSSASHCHFPRGLGFPRMGNEVPF
jgi:hypothetical protein